MMTDSIEIITGVSILVVTPALVEVAKQMGLPIRWAGIAAIVFATVLVVLGDIASFGIPPLADDGMQSLARWLIGGVVYGLAAAGLYSQTRLRDRPPAMA